MPNFGKGFAQTFNLQPTANLISQYLINKGQNKGKAQAEEAQRQQDLAMIQALISGTPQTEPLNQGAIGNNMPQIPIDTMDRKVAPNTDQLVTGLVGNGKVTQNRPLDNLQQAQAYYSLSNTGRQTFNKTNPDFFKTPEPKKPEPITSTQMVDAGTIPGLENYKGKGYSVEVRTKKKGDKVVDTNYGQPFKPTEPTPPTITSEEFVPASKVKGLGGLGKDYYVLKTTQTKGGKVISTKYGSPHKREKIDGSGEKLTPVENKFLNDTESYIYQYQTALNYAKTYGSVEITDPDTGLKSTYTANQVDKYFQTGINTKISTLKSMLGKDVKIYDETYNKFLKNKKISDLSDQEYSQYIADLAKNIDTSYTEGKLSGASYKIYSKLMFLEFGVKLSDVLKTIGAK